MAGFAHLVAPTGGRERQRWFPLAGRVPEALLGRTGRFIPWRTLVEFPSGEAGAVPAPPGVVVGLSLTAEGLRRWEAGRRRRYLTRLVEDLAAKGARVVGLGRGLFQAPECAEPVREAVCAQWKGEGAGVVAGWVGRLAGGLAAVEVVAATRRWDLEQVEVVMVGGETPEGRVAARLLARRCGRLTLAGEGQPLQRLAVQLLHETGTAARVGGSWDRLLRRADLVVLAASWPAGVSWAAVRPDATVVDLRAEAGAHALFTWPAGRPSAGLSGAVWASGEGRETPLVSADLATVAAVGAEAGSGAGDAGEVLRLATSPEPTLEGVDAVRRALQRAGFRAVAVLDKAGAELL